MAIAPNSPSLQALRLLKAVPGWAVAKRCQAKATVVRMPEMARMDLYGETSRHHSCPRAVSRRNGGCSIETAR